MAKKKAVEAVLTKLIGLVRKKSANIRDIKKGNKKLPGAKADRDRELNRLEADLAAAKEKVKKQKAKLAGAPDTPRKALDEAPTKKTLKKKRKAVRDEPKDRKGPKAKKRIAEEEKLDKRKSEKDERRANRGLADDERAGITDKLEGRLQEEKDLRRFGNKGRDFEAKVDSVDAGRGAFRKKLDFDRQDLAKQQNNYARQNARANNTELPASERRAAKEEMRKLRAQFGDAVVSNDIKLAKRPAPQKRTPIGDKKKAATKPVSLRDAFNKAKAADKSSFTFDGKKFNVGAVADRFKKAEEEFGLNRGGAVKKPTGAHDYRKGGMVISTVDRRKKK